MRILCAFLLSVIFCSKIVYADRICVQVVGGQKFYTNRCNGQTTEVPPNTPLNPKKFSISLTDPEFPKQKIEKIVEEKASFYGVDPKLIKELITQESGWNPKAVSPMGAMGLMQLMPKTAIMLGVKDPFNVIENIDGGIKYMKYLLEKFNNNIQLALAAYNAGPSLVESLGRIPNIPETQNYVKAISMRYAGNYEYSENANKSRYAIKNSPIKAVVLSDGTVVYVNKDDAHLWSIQ